MTYIVYEIPPEGFHSQYDVSGCFIVFKGNFLLLKRIGGDQSGKWGVPAGKREERELLLETLIREVREETSIALKNPRYLETLYIVYRGIYYRFHMYVEDLDACPDVVLNSEHSEYQWLSAHDALNLPLIAGGIEAVNTYHKRIEVESKWH